MTIQEWKASLQKEEAVAPQCHYKRVGNNVKSVAMERKGRRTDKENGKQSFMKMDRKRNAKSTKEIYSEWVAATAALRASIWRARRIGLSWHEHDWSFHMYMLVETVSGMTLARS